MSDTLPDAPAAPAPDAAGENAAPTGDATPDAPPAPKAQTVDEQLAELRAAYNSLAEQLEAFAEVQNKRAAAYDELLKPKPEVRLMTGDERLANHAARLDALEAGLKDASPNFCPAV